MARKKMKRKPASPASSPGDRLIHQIAAALDRRGVRYAVIGGQAVNQHGHHRFTRDVDFTVQLGPSEAAPVIAVAAETDLSTSIPALEEWVAEMHVLPFSHAASGLGVDFSFVDSKYIQLAIDRCVAFDIDGYPVRFLAIEDLIVHKVIANRPQDRTDIVELLNRHGTADLDYIRHWLRQFEEIIDAGLVERFDNLIND